MKYSKVTLTLASMVVELYKELQDDEGLPPEELWGRFEIYARVVARGDDRLYRNICYAVADVLPKDDREAIYHDNQLPKT